MRTVPVAVLTGCQLLAGPAHPHQDLRRLDGSVLKAAQADRAIEKLMAAGKVHGLGVAVFNNNRLVYLRAFGYKDVQAKARLTVDSVMYGASLTKAVFATAVMQLVEEEVLDLDRPVIQYLPRSLGTYEKWRELAEDPRHTRITARMLLSHTAGLANFRFLNPDGKLRLHFEPGARYAYSGEGLNFLQFVLEELTGQPVGEQLQRRIFDRFGMTRTSMTWREDFRSDLAMGHDETGRNLGHHQRESVRAAGSMDTTLADIARFQQGLMGGEALSAKGKQEMLRPQVRIHSRQQFPTLSLETTTENDPIALSYGLGWGLFTSRAHGRAYFKEGHTEGWENHLVCFGDQGTALILLSNSSNGDGIFKVLLETLIGDRETPWLWEGYLPYHLPPRATPVMTPTTK